eukprot:UN16973
MQKLDSTQNEFFPQVLIFFGEWILSYKRNCFPANVCRNCFPANSQLFNQIKREKKKFGEE